MALVVEDGTGLTTSESYLSVSAADVYLAKFGDTSWQDLEEADKEVHLRLATRYIDLKYGPQFQGTRTNETQSLQWPRRGVYDDAGYLIDSTSMPQALGDATAEAARRSVTDTLMGDIDTADSGTVVKDEVKVGPIEIRTEMSGGRAITKRYPQIDRILLINHLISGIDEVNLA